MSFVNLFVQFRITILTLTTILIILLISRSSLPHFDTHIKFPSSFTTSTTPSTSTTVTSTSPSRFNQQPTSSDSSSQPPWLIFTSSSSLDFQRRQLIRWSWVNTFANSTIYEHIFALTTTNPLHISLAKKENETYGDILLLDNIEDDHHIANTIKPVEVLKRLTREGWKGRTNYDFVGKLDQDSWIDPIRVWQKYLRRRLNMATDGIGKERFILSMPHDGFCGCPSPQGGFYALGWSIAKLIGDIFDEVGVPMDGNDQEDCMVGRLPWDKGEEFEFVAMDPEESFDVGNEDDGFKAYAWTPDDDTKEEGSIEEVKKAVFLHQLKDDSQWMELQALFDENGWTGNKTVNSTMTEVTNKTIITTDTDLGKLAGLDID